MISRRAWGMAVGAIALSSGATASAAEPGLGPVKRARTELLDIAYHDVGPRNGDVVLLGHGWPYSPHAYAEVAPALARRGYRVIVPYLRGHGPTRFLSAATFRSGEQAALGSDMISLLDALKIRTAIFGDYDWGGRALNVAAALWPSRCAGLVSVNSYLIQKITLSDLPDPAAAEAAHWYFFYFLTERGRAGLARDPREVARVVWDRNSPQWRYTEQDLADAASAFSNPDYVDIVLHSYRHRLRTEPVDPRYSAIEAQLGTQPPITVPTVTLDGLADGSIPATDGTASARFFTGPRVHQRIPQAGHNLPQETPNPSSTRYSRLPASAEKRSSARSSPRAGEPLFSSPEHWSPGGWMTVRAEVLAFVDLGRLPSEDDESDDADEKLEQAERRLHAIERPVSGEEAQLLVNCFGDDNCFGLAWSLLHLVESAPGPVVSGPSENMWMDSLWQRYAGSVDEAAGS
jgi:pimeloyl-ACP methyl ester carboxylesterase